MVSGGRNWRSRLARWLDEWRLAFSGLILATRDLRFVIAFVIAFIVFGTLMTLLSGSTAALGLFWSVGIDAKLKIIGDGFLGLFGVGRNFWDWLLTFSVTLLQSALIGLVVFVWQRRRRSRKEQVVATAANAENVQNAGIAAGLAVLGTGCPTCGTTLLAPVIGSLFSTSGYAIAGAISWVITIAAIVIALFSLKRIGKDAYAMIVSERYARRIEKEKKS